MSLKQHKSLAFFLLVGSAIALLACKSTATPPFQPEPIHKPPPITESDINKDDATEWVDKAPTANDKSPKTLTDSGSDTQDQQHERIPPLPKQNHVTSLPQATQGDPQRSKPVASAPPDPDAARTNAELTSEMDRQLQESLSTFDGRLLKKRLLLEDLQDAAAGGEQPGGTPGDFSTAGDVGTGSPDSDAGGNRPAVADSENLPATTTGTPGKAERGGTPPDNVPPDIPDGRDDDIVARQIREAAMREKDPELRKKLWDEYRRYKQSSGAYTP